MISESIDAKTSELVRTFSGNADGLALAVRDWYRLFPQSFFRIANRELRPERDTLILQMMLADTDCCRHLCDPVLLEMRDAIALARNLQTAGQHLDIRLAQAAIEWADDGANRDSLRRCLSLLDSLTPGSRITGFLVQLLTSRDGVVRSKAFELLLRSSSNEREGQTSSWDPMLPQLFHRTWGFNEQNIRGWLGDPDPRVRANLIEFLSRTYPEVEWVHEVLREHLSDPHGRVAANSAVGLLRMGIETEAITRLSEMAAHADPNIRSSAAWAMGQARNPQFSALLDRLRTDADPRVRWNALKSMKRARNLAALQEKSTESPDLPATGTSDG